MTTTFSLSPLRAGSRYGLLCMLAAGILLSACTTTRVGNDYDRSARFTGYQTYAWLQREHNDGRNPLAVRFAKEAVDAELMQRGFSLAEDPAAADFEVDLTIGAHDRIDVNSYPVGFRGPWTWGSRYYGDQIEIRNYREGTLAIDIFDGKTHQPVWTGWATKELSSSDRVRSDGPIREATAAVLAQFPPASASKSRLE